MIQHNLGGGWQLKKIESLATDDELLDLKCKDVLNCLETIWDEFPSSVVQDLFPEWGITINTMLAIDMILSLIPKQINAIKNFSDVFCHFDILFNLVP